ncbi:uncharacterized protein LOC143223849 [Tachypleus tridentatus]|uniref:uncharacterized protein LOC143223849 n=1 Tax=Tachypleus tridentatus TaxID=6853 RepID=UPI003FD284B9
MTKRFQFRVNSNVSSVESNVSSANSSVSSVNSNVSSVESNVSSANSSVSSVNSNVSSVNVGSVCSAREDFAVVYSSRIEELSTVTSCAGLRDVLRMLQPTSHMREQRSRDDTVD